MAAPPARRLLRLLLLLWLLLPPPPTRAVACGRPRRPQARIIGGADAPEKQWPWQASVHYLGFHICGGSIIHAYWILSAAHCFRYRNIRAFDVYVGLVDLGAAGSHTQWFEVHRVILHPTYERYHPVGGDIALVQLKSRIEFSDSVLPVCLPPPDLDLLGLSCWATGWGLTSQQGTIPCLPVRPVVVAEAGCSGGDAGGETSDKLQEVPLPVIPLFLCQVLHGQSHVGPDMLCAGDFGNMRTVCEGDSGGPLVCESNRSWVQTGVVSWGRGCSQPLYPAVFSRVSYFSEWIRRQVAVVPPPPQPLPALASALRAATVTLRVTALAVLSAR